MQMPLFARATPERPEITPPGVLRGILLKCPDQLGCRGFVVLTGDSKSFLKQNLLLDALSLSQRDCIEDGAPLLRCEVEKRQRHVAITRGHEAILHNRPGERRHQSPEHYRVRIL